MRTFYRTHAFRTAVSECVHCRIHWCPTLGVRLLKTRDGRQYWVPQNLVWKPVFLRLGPCLRHVLD